MFSEQRTVLAADREFRADATDYRAEAAAAAEKRCETGKTGSYGAGVGFDMSPEVDFFVKF